MQAFNVYLNDKLIDTVFYSESPREACDDVRKSLINHDGYNAGIVVRRRRDGAPKKKTGGPMLPPPYRVEGVCLKQIDHGHWYTIASTASKHFTREGQENTAAYLGRACNSHQAMRDALEALLGGDDRDGNGHCRHCGGELEQDQQLCNDGDCEGFQGRSALKLAGAE